VTEPVWVLPEIVHAIHDAQLSEHGGADGIRDARLIDSALARPHNLYAYSSSLSIPRLAACSTFGLAKNQGFLDGNKRLAAVACELFLQLNGFRLDADDAAWLRTVLAVAEGSLDEDGLAQWLETNAAAVRSA
jgi:death on curing protein